MFNPAAWTDGKTIWLLYRAEDKTGIGQWNGTSRIGLATSRDGLDFQRKAEPVLEPTEAWEIPGGVEDPRLVKVEDLFYLTYTAYDGRTARLALASSKDLRRWKKHGLVFPDRGWTKAGAILPTPINGKYWMYFGDSDIRAATSTDLLHWNVIEEPVLRHRAGTGKFDSKLVEPGPPPLLTVQGILLLFNGANDENVYASGQALFDRNDPTKLLARTDSPFLQPTANLERDGQVPRVVFIEGLVRFKKRWFLYYGMADSRIGVALYHPESTGER
ncbi:MAG: glycoside hydrolase family 130 protein [Terriglobia bacterium]